MEIERKFIPLTPPVSLESCPYHDIEQAYLSESPAIRVRKEDSIFYLTYKNGAAMAHEEYNLPLTEAAYQSLLAKCDGRVLTKRRYLIPYGPYTIELDVFSAPFDGLRIAEVEFPSVEEAEAFEKPDWFGEEVTSDRRYRNSYLALSPEI
ncbi:MAG: CYTH domain-containing protein [Lachnospiraceae bacterium]|nr:CYTH domain-containing protein [Lachnospiraceae bacterium]